MGARHLDVCAIAEFVDAVVPVDDAVGLGVDGDLRKVGWELVAKRVEEFAGAVAAVAVRLLVGGATLPLKNAAADEVGRLEDEGVDADATEGGAHGDARGDKIRPASGRAAGDHTAEAVADQVDGVAGLLAGVL